MNILPNISINPKIDTNICKGVYCKATLVRRRRLGDSVEIFGTNTKGFLRGNHHVKYRITRNWSVNIFNGKMVIFYYYFQLVDMPFDALIAYDNRCFVRPNSGYRRALLRAWIDIAGSKTSVAANGTTGDVVGFACRRPASAAGNHLIGPFYADSLSVASDLVQDLCGDVAGQTILINVWLVNSFKTYFCFVASLYSLLMP